MINKRIWCTSRCTASFFAVLTLVGLGMSSQAVAQIQEMTVTPVEAEGIVSDNPNVVLLVIDSAIPGLTITSNIEELGRMQLGSQTIISLQAGRQNITLTAPSYRNASISLDASERESYKYEVFGITSERITAARNQMSDQPELKQRGNGLKWLGGAVLLGGAAAAYVLTQGGSTVPDLPLPPARP